MYYILGTLHESGIGEHLGYDKRLGATGYILSKTESHVS
jgi:hypothetical protein